MEYRLHDIAVASSAFVNALSRMYFGRKWPWFLAPVAGLGLAAVALHDTRWLIAGLALTFMVYPMILILLYINHALTPEARWSISKKTVTIGSEGITLDFCDERMHSHLIAWTDISQALRNSEYIFFHLRARAYTFLMIPREAIGQQGIDEEEFSRYITRQLKHNIS